MDRGRGKRELGRETVHVIGQIAVQAGHSSVEPGEQCSIEGGSADRA